MINIPEYTSYSNETQIALLDNSSIAFMEQMQQKGFVPETMLSSYDAIFVPGYQIYHQGQKNGFVSVLKEYISQTKPNYQDGDAESLLVIMPTLNLMGLTMH